MNGYHGIDMAQGMAAAADANGVAHLLRTARRLVDDEYGEGASEVRHELVASVLAALVQTASVRFKLAHGGQR